MTLMVAVERWRQVEEALALGKPIAHLFPKPPRPLVGEGSVVGWAWVWNVGGAGVAGLMEPEALTFSIPGEVRTLPLGPGTFQAFTKYWRETWTG